MKIISIAVGVCVGISLGFAASPCSTVRNGASSKGGIKFVGVGLDSSKPIADVENKVKKRQFMRSFLIEGMMNNKWDSVYVQDRKLLEKLSGASASDDHLVFESKSSRNNIYKIDIERRAFVAGYHEMELVKEVGGKTNVINRIDGKLAYGINGKRPRYEFKKMEISIDGNRIWVPKLCFNDLFDPEFSGDNMSVEAYESENGKLLYVYLHGGQEDAPFCVKLVFDHKIFVTRIVLTDDFATSYDYLDGTR
jgi:hypothetical protein